MTRSLDRVEDWVAIATASEFYLRRMAKAVHVFERTLRRHIREHFGSTAKEWRDTRRLEIALESLRCGE
jgi:transcriptional regulator GlxA family with amidase domain